MTEKLIKIKLICTICGEELTKNDVKYTIKLSDEDLIICEECKKMEDG